jgi:hypothetical protein
MNYVLAKINAEQDFQIEENIIQEKEDEAAEESEEDNTQDYSVEVSE